MLRSKHDQADRKYRALLRKIFNPTGATTGCEWHEANSKKTWSQEVQGSGTFFGVKDKGTTRTPTFILRNQTQARIMPNALTLFKANSVISDAWLQAFDARTIAVQGNLVITTPNMHFVLEFHHFEAEGLQARADGRFGMIDCFQWPQAYDDTFCHASCIPRKEAFPSPRPLHWAWFTPTQDDLKPIPGNLFPVGTLGLDKVDGLQSLFKLAEQQLRDYRKAHPDRGQVIYGRLMSLRHAVARLKSHPLTFRDLLIFVTDAQHLFLDIYSYLNWGLEAQPLTTSGLRHNVWGEWMGTFVQSSDCLQEIILRRHPHLITSSLACTTHLDPEYSRGIGSKGLWPQLVRCAPYPKSDEVQRTSGGWLLWLSAGGLPDEHRETSGGVQETPEEFHPLHWVQRTSGGPKVTMSEGYDVRRSGGPEEVDRILRQEKEGYNRQGVVQRFIYCKGSERISKLKTNAMYEHVETDCLNPSPKVSSLGKAPSQQKSKPKHQPYSIEARPARPAQSGESRNKWQDPDTPYLPLPNLHWEAAMKIALKDQSHIHTPYVIDRGYRFPEPALLLGPKVAERLQVYLANWLASRALWLGRVDHDPLCTYPTPQLWRDFLGSVPSAKPQSHMEKDPDRRGLTATEKRKQVMRELFGDDVLESQGDVFSPDGVVEFRGEQFSVASLTNPSALLAQKVTWELFELGFRYELRDLDCHLAQREWKDDPAGCDHLLHGIFPGDAGLVMWSEPFLSEQYGLWDNTLQGSLPYLENFRRLLCDWDGVPPLLMTPLTSDNFTDTKSWEVKRVAMVFYMQTFFDHFGRPPIVPHSLPMQS
ncbi:hypothetical protein F4604DRAFT_1685744 [Suillus subluteus]|nr:hypothetical protein F4604DRAFT_1685744 [Suillus subluteus]